MEIVPGQTSRELDTVAHEFIMRAAPTPERCGHCGYNRGEAGTPECLPANCSEHPTPCGAGDPPHYTSELAADFSLFSVVASTWGFTERAAFWEALTRLLLEAAGHASVPRSAFQPLVLMTYYRPGDYTRAALRTL